MLSRSQHSLKLKKQAAVDDLNLVCQEIDKIFSLNFSGKHTQVNATILLDALSRGLLFHGEAIPLHDEKKWLYGGHWLQCNWRM